MGGGSCRVCRYILAPPSLAPPILAPASSPATSASSPTASSATTPSGKLGLRSSTADGITAAAATRATPPAIAPLRASLAASEAFSQPSARAKPVSPPRGLGARHGRRERGEVAQRGRRVALPPARRPSCREVAGVAGRCRLPAWHGWLAGLPRTTPATRGPRAGAPPSRGRPLPPTATASALRPALRRSRRRRQLGRLVLEGGEGGVDVEGDGELELGRDLDTPETRPRQPPREGRAFPPSSRWRDPRGDERREEAGDERGDA